MCIVRGILKITIIWGCFFLIPWYCYMCITKFAVDSISFSDTITHPDYNSKQLNLIFILKYLLILILSLINKQMNTTVS